MKKQGHYCKVCGSYRANEKFTGKGHATHICKDCAKLPPEEKAKQEALNRLFNLPWHLSKEQKAWLKKQNAGSPPGSQGACPGAIRYAVWAQASGNSAR